MAQEIRQTEFLTEGQFRIFIEKGKPVFSLLKDGTKENPDQAFYLCKSALQVLKDASTKFLVSGVYADEPDE